MLKRLTIIALSLGAFGCRDGQFENREKSLEQVALTIAPLESQDLGACSDKPNCQKMEISFEVKTRNGASLNSENFSFHAAHAARVLSADQTAATDARGIVTFQIEFQVYPFERGLRFQTLFQLQSARFGMRSFSGLVEPSLSSGPLHTFKPCEPENFKAVVFGELPQFDADPSDVTVLGVTQAEGPVRHANLRATFQIRDLQKLSPTINLPVKWSLTMGPQSSSGVATTDQSGKFDLDFVLAFSPFENEKNTVVIYSIEALSSPEKKMTGYFSLNLEKTNLRPMIAKGRGLPSPTTPDGVRQASISDQLQTIDIRPIVLRQRLEESELTLDQNLRLVASRSYDFQAAVSITRSRLTDAPELVSLAGIRTLGKVFLVVTTRDSKSSVIYEQTFNEVLDPEGKLNLRLKPALQNFNVSSDQLDVYLALLLPDFHDVQTAYAQIKTSRTNEFSIHALSRGAAEEVLQDRLLDLRTQAPPAPAQTSSKEKLFQNLISIRTAPEATLSEASKRTLYDRLQRGWQSDAAAVWTEIYSLLISPQTKEERSRITPSFILENLRVREVIFVDQIESVQLVDKKEENFSGRTKGDLRLQAQVLSFLVRGKGERCLSLSAARPGEASQVLNFYYCFEDKTSFEFTDFWYVVEDASPKVDIITQEMGVNARRFLLKDPLPKEISLDSLEKSDLFLHPERHRPRLLSRMLWPRVAY